MIGKLKDLARAAYRRIPLARSIYRPLRRRVARAMLPRRVARFAARGQALRIVIGANRKHPSGWVPTEVYALDLLEEADWQRCFRPATIDALLAEHVWEHLTREQGTRAGWICHRYLKPGGRLRVAVPDGLFPHPDYLEFVRPGGSGPSAWDHKELYTYQTLPPVFTAAGFRVELLEYHDENGRFHYHPWNVEDGLIQRSSRCPQGRRFGELEYRSLILDAIKDSPRQPLT